MDPVTLNLLVTTGLKITQLLVEHRLGKKLEDTSPEELRAELLAMEVLKPAELIARGRAAQDA